MRTKWMLLGLVATMPAHAGKPPMFKPDMPPSWTWQQKQLANKALDVLFDACPGLLKWFPDMAGANIAANDLADPINEQERRMLAPLGWSHALVVSIYTIPRPQNPMFEGDHTVVDFYLGEGKRTGIFMQGGFFPLAACGAKPSYTFRWEYDRSSDKSEDPDIFVAAPALKILSNL